MKNQIDVIRAYLAQIPAERKEVFEQLYTLIRENLPEGFGETMSYGMISWVVPKEIYPSGYHCDTNQPLPFMSLANQKNFIAFYHMGIYAKEDLNKWFTENYPKHAKYKLDMGKSCIRFKKMNDIPFELIEELVKQMSVQEWINLYESNLKRS